MRIEDVNTAVENGTTVLLEHIGITMRYKISGVISRYDKVHGWYYCLELQDLKAPHSITVVRIEDVRTESEGRGTVGKN